MVVAPHERAARLDVFLCRRLDVSRGAARRMIEAGGIRIDDRVCPRAGTALHTGQEVCVERRDLDAAPVPQGELDVAVLAKGRGWIVVDKPAGVPVHPLLPRERDTVLNAVIARFPRIVGVGDGGLRCGVVHRLDVETSGALLLATSDLTWRRLRKAFGEHEVHKTYRAIVHGRLDGERRETAHLVVARHRPALVRVASSDAKGARACRLTWRAVDHFERHTLVEVDLETGFLHQVRVMLAHLGHPVVGDVTYGRSTDDAPRQMLHASAIRYRSIRARSPDPSDFIAVSQALPPQSPDH